MKELKESDKDPGLLLIIRADVTLSESMTYEQVMKEIYKEKIVKYVYTNAVCNPGTVKENIKLGKYDFIKLRKLYSALERYLQVNVGGAHTVNC